MQLTVQQAASFLDVPERQIYRWLDEGEIPFSREQGRIHFNQAELLEWATARGVRPSHSFRADADMLVDVMLAREAAGSTAVGDGIAIPHVRAPIVQNGVAPAIALCTLAQPIDFGARDGKPVHTLFLLVTPTVSVHLLMLARLAAALHDREFKSAVLRRAPAEEILAHAHRLDAAKGRR